MIVSGYRADADFFKAQAVIKKHTTFSISDVKNICEAIKEGKAVNLPDDFVLKEDLLDLSFFVD